MPRHAHSVLVAIALWLGASCDDPPAFETGVLEGTVTLDGATDHSGILVTMSDGGGTTATGPDGTYRFSGLEPGTYRVTAARGGYVSGTLEDVTVIAGEIRTADPLELDAVLGEISGTVRLEGRTDHSGAQVSLVGTALTATTSDTGAYSFPAAPSGTYVARASASGFRDAVSDPIVVDELGTAVVVAPLLVQIPRGSVAGVATLEGESDHAGVLVTLLDTPYAALTGPTGAYVLSSVPVGQYTVVATRPTFTTAFTTDVTVDEGQTAAVPALVLAANPGAIAGRVFKEGTTNHTGVLVTVNGTPYSGATLADGSFQIDGVPGGFYSISASLAGYQRYDFPLVVVTAGETTPVGDATIVRARGRIQGVVTLANKTVHSGVRVDLLGSSYFTSSAADGTYELLVPVGNYVGVRLSREHYATVDLASTVTVTEEGIANLTPVELAGVSNDLAGRVTRFGALDHSGVTVELTGVVGTATEGETFSMVTTDPDGDFGFTAIPLGQYDVRYIYQAGWGTIRRGLTVPAGDPLTLPAEELRQRFVIIDEDSPFTTSSSVTLTLGSSDCFQMKISNLPTLADAAWGPCAAGASWTLAGPDGNNAVYARFLDSALVESETVTDTIWLDGSAAIASVTEDTGGATQYRNDVIHLALDAGESGGTASVDILGYAAGIALVDGGSGIYEADYAVQLSQDVNGATVVGHFTDSYGNVAAPVTAVGTVTIAVPPVISGVLVVPDSVAGTAAISWATDELATGRVQWGTTDFYGNEVLAGSYAASHSIVLGAGSLVPSTAYHYRITATDVAGNPSMTADRTFYVRPNKPAMVVALPGVGRFDLRWEAPPQDNVVGYRVYRSTTAGGPYSLLTVTPVAHEALTYSDATAAMGVTYHYVVTAVDGFGNESEHSDEVSGAAAAAGTGPTIVSGGALVGNQVWTSKGSPYLVQGNLAVQPGNYLAIGPGVEVKFTGAYYVRVDGQLVTVGDAGSEVVFTSNAVTPAAGDWNGLKFTASAAPGRLDTTNGTYLAGNLMYRTRVAYSGQSGVTITSATVALLRATILSNTSSVGGGGLAATSSAIVVADSTLTGNTASGASSAGGLYASGGTTTLLRSSVSANTKIYGTNFGAGGISAASATVSLVDSLVDGNVGQVTGPPPLAGNAGGIYASACTLSIVDSTISGNSTASGYTGAGLAASSSSLTMVGTDVVSNTVTIDRTVGGGLYLLDGQATIVASNISSNTGTAVSTNHDGAAGGILVRGGTVLLWQTDLMANQSAASSSLPTAGGIAAVGGSTVSVVGGTLSGNAVSAGSGAQALYASTGSSVRLNACLVADAPASSYPVVAGLAEARWNRFEDNAATTLIRAVTAGSAVIHFNSFLDTTPTRFVKNEVVFASGNVDATANYWGASTTTFMNANGAAANVATIFDYYDDITYSKVTYSGWTQSAYPLAAIATPLWGSTSTQGEAVVLVGSATDPEDGAIPGASLAWSSETDGPLGTGASLPVTSLTAGTHRIWLTATDAAGLESKTWVEIEVTP